LKINELFKVEGLGVIVTGGASGLGLGMAEALAAYMTAKAGAAHLMRSVALELAAYRITVNAIAPGFFATNIGGGHAKQPQVQEAMSKVIPMHRVGVAKDLAGLALFLASPASAYLTGQQISIDGGWSLGVAD
jgi:NAD(P)-dependent dehydrogenase (short-subunit alcohol dehydrogenase family)